MMKTGLSCQIMLGRSIHDAAVVVVVARVVTTLVTVLRLILVVVAVSVILDRYTTEVDLKYRLGCPRVSSLCLCPGVLVGGAGEEEVVRGTRTLEWTIATGRTPAKNIESFMLQLDVTVRVGG